MHITDCTKEAYRSGIEKLSNAIVVDRILRINVKTLHLVQHDRGNLTGYGAGELLQRHIRD